MDIRHMQHKEFSLAERQYIELRLLGNWSFRQMASAMGRHHTAILREVRRNTKPGSRYRADEAERLAKRRLARRVRSRKLDRDPELAGWVEAHLRDGWSPEKISGRLKHHPPPWLDDRTVSHEAIYGWIYEGGGRYGGLHECLWTHRKRRWSHKGRKETRGHLTDRVPISERPVDGLPGHLESDSMIWSSDKGLLSVQTCRMLKVSRLRWCPDRSAAETSHALRRAVETLPHGFVRDVSFDNGKENADHLALRKEYGISTFFCAPHAPWQKSQVENLNRTIRHWLPRKTKISALTGRDWKMIEERLNNLPRKSLSYLTPNEALHQYLARGATGS